MSSSPTPSIRSRHLVRLLAFTGLAATVAASAARLVQVREPELLSHGLRTVPVRRADVDAVVLTSGRVASSRSTDIRCTLERIDLADQGGSSVQSSGQKE